MSFLVTLEEWNCERVAEVSDHGLLADLLPNYYDDSYMLLRFIDEQGNTAFNSLQMPTFLDEWHRLYSLAQSEAHLELLEKIEQLAKRCESGADLYLKFYGD